MSTEDKNPIKPVTKAEVDAGLRLLFEYLRSDNSDNLNYIKGIREKIEILKTMKSMIDDKG